MFDFVRKYTKVIAIPLFLLIILAFVLVGVNGYTGLSGASATVAKVGGHSITQSEWDFAHKNEVDRLRASMPSVDPKLLESPDYRYATLERLVRERVLTEAVQSSHLNVSDAKVVQQLRQIPPIAALISADGKLEVEQLRPMAASQGLTPEGFLARVRSDLLLQQMEIGMASTAFSVPSLADTALNAYFQKREVQIVRFASADYANKITPTDEEIEAYYKTQQAMFQAPESANLEYVVLDADAVKKSITVTEADLKAYYKDNAERLSAKEERRASHILINAPKGMSDADRAKAKERATALLAQVRAAPASFADVAKKNSQDVGSAPSGGDLDFFAKGAMVKPFEEAVFALKKGDISDVVESDFGFHIIRLTDIKSPKQPTFDDLRAGMEADMRNQQARTKFAEVAEAFTNGVYEQSDSLKPIADKLKLEVKTATNVQRGGAPTANGVLSNPQLLAAVFSADSVEKKRNTEAIKLGANQLVSARITQYTPARALPLNEVKNLVRERLINSRAMEQAKQEGTGKLAAWKGGEAPANLPAAVTVSRDADQAIKGPILDAAMRADPANLPAWVGVDMGSQGYAVVRVNKVLPRTMPSDATAKQERGQYAQLVANVENQAYFELLKDRFKAQVKVTRPVHPAMGTPAQAQ